VCGDAIPAYVLKVLATIDPSYRTAFEKVPEKNSVYMCRYVSPDRTTLDIRLRETGIVCRRTVFGSFLLNLSSGLKNLTVFKGMPIKDIKTGGKGVTVITGSGNEVNAQMLIGCDGISGVSKNLLSSPPGEPSEGSVAFRAYFSGIKDNPPGILEFHFLKDLSPGYFWIFPLPGNEFNAGIGMPSEIVRSLNINLRDRMMKIIETDPFIGPRFSGASMTEELKGGYLPLCTRKRRISGERFMLCGDAASLVNPATGAGIGQAMQSGRYAAWHTIKCFEKVDFSTDFTSLYDKILYEKLWTSNRNYLLIRNLLMKNPKAINMATHVAKSSRLIRKVISGWL
jgi:flavin-dependent dehydrogenase